VAFEQAPRLLDVHRLALARGREAPVQQEPVSAERGGLLQRNTRGDEGGCPANAASAADELLRARVGARRPRG
jgi:hypothetical protein